MELSPGEFVLAGASGPVQAGDGLRVDSASHGDVVRGTVRNGTPFDLEQARVFVGKNWVRVDDLPAGAERTFEVPATPGGAHWRMPGQEAWDQEARWRGFEDGEAHRSEIVSYSLWQTSTSLPLGEPLRPGQALVAAWTRDFRPTLRLGERSHRPAGRTLVLAYGDVAAPGEGALDPLDVIREEVRGVQYLGPEPGWDEVDVSAGPLVLRFTLPRDPQAPLILAAPASLQRLEIWRNGAWEDVQVTVPAPGPVPEGEVVPRILPQPDGGFAPPGQPDDERLDTRIDQALPPVDGRVLYLRVTQDPEAAAGHAGWAFDLREQR